MRVTRRNSGDAGAVAAMTDRVTPEEIRAMGDLFFQASDPTRLRILLRLLASCGCVCELSGELGLSVSAVSHQLKKLRLAGLVSRSREGRHVRYRLADDHVKKLLVLGLEHIRE